jgi:signal transduction histidine kinase
MAQVAPEADGCKGLWELFPDGLGTAFESEYSRAMNERVAVRFEEFLPSLQAWFDVAAYPSQEGISVYFRNSSERKVAEQERERILEREQKARADAEAANRLKDEFLATVSHELRTPLTAILGWSSLLHIGGLDEDMAKTALDTIERNARSQVQLIDDLLDVSRIITGKLRLDVREIELVQIINAAIESVRPAASAKNIELSTSLDASASAISGDASRLQQVVWNLLTQRREIYA